MIHDDEVTLMDTWRAMEDLLRQSRKLRSIGLSDVSLKEVREVFESATIKPAVVQVESHPYLPQTDILDFCNQNGIVMQAFAPLVHGMKPGVLEDPVIRAVAGRVNQTPAQVLLAWAVQRGLQELPPGLRKTLTSPPFLKMPWTRSNAVQTRQRLNPVTATGIPGFIAGSK